MKNIKFNFRMRRSVYPLVCMAILGVGGVSIPVSVSASPHPALIQQQTYVITGKVTDSNGMPIIGASVRDKNAPASGTITDIDGKFKLNVSRGSVLVVSYIGYNDREFTVTAEKNYSIVLKESTEALDEVVVVGYGTQKKVNLTGSVSTLKADKLENRTSVNVSNLLAGQMAGVTVTQSSGQPGSDASSIRVRGIGTMNSGSNAMVVIDGIEGSLSDVDPNDIDNISILKDAAASSIYGVRAANGVILITTKKGKKGKTRIDYNGYVGWQDATRIPDFADSYDFAVLMNEAYTNDGSKAPYSEEDLKKFKDHSDPVNYPDSRWLKDLLSENGFFHNHYLAASGGNDQINYSISLGYRYQDGLIPNTNFDKLNFRTRLNAALNKRLSVNLDISGYRSKAEAPSEGMDYIIHYAYREIPVSPIEVNGHYVRFKNEHNSIQSAKEGGVSEQLSTQFSGKIGLEYKILDGLKFRGNAAARYYINESKVHSYSVNYFAPGNYKQLLQSKNSLTSSDYKTYEVNLQAYLDYSRTFGNHTVNGLLGYSQIYDNAKNLMAYRKNLPVSNSLDQINAGEEEGQKTGGNEIESSLRSVFARINYSYHDRYLFEANVRYDGTSRFKRKNRFGAFPSFSFGWRISEEEFFKVKNINNLKLRASWGKLGNQEFANYAFYNTYIFTRNYSFGGVKVPAISIDDIMANEEISWEKTNQVDLGLDLGCFNNRLTLTFDYFNKQTNDILLTLPIMSMVGVKPPYQNAGAVRNSGFELQIGHNNTVKDFSYSISANASYVKNKITDLKGSDIPGQSVGDPLMAFYGYECEGIFRNEQQIKEHADQSLFKPVPGDLIYKDLNGDKVINSKDRKVLGSAFPKWYYGLNLSANYKGFDFSTVLQGVAGVKAMVPAEIAWAFYNGGKVTTKYLDRWTPENANGSMPRMSMSNESNHKISSFWVKDASFLKMRNVQLGYSLPKNILKHYGIQKLRLYSSIDNLFTITSFEGTDPEATQNVHPITRSYSFGINLTF